MTKETKLGVEATANGLEQCAALGCDDEAAVLAIRNLVFDICTQNGGGHGGSALGMAAIGVALWKYVMRYNPADPEWFDRDRFVLSNGNDRTNFPTATPS
jgi:dihydroxyacetone synthase